MGKEWRVLGPSEERKGKNGGGELLTFSLGLVRF